MTKILLIGDSYGTERPDNVNNEAVPLAQTWPEIVRRKLGNMAHVSTDFQVYRTIVKCATLIERNYGDFDITVLQAGIVDCYPRPLTEKGLGSKRFFPRLLRVVIRNAPHFWIRHVYRKPFHSREQIIKAIELILENKEGTVYLLTVPPVSRYQAMQTPGAQEAIFELNDLYRELSNQFKNLKIIDLYIEFLRQGYERFINTKNSHLNKIGNSFTASLVFEEISKDIYSKLT